MVAVSQLRKNYGATSALKDISFEIPAGEFFGLLGPNGAGKTTTISIISAIAKADHGSIRIDGYDMASDPNKCKACMGVVPQEIALYNDLTAYQNLAFWGGLYGLSSNQLKTEIDHLLSLFGLYDRRKDRVRSYSGGMKRRINIAAALLHRPKILIMDEPTVGIDPHSRNLIFEVVEKLHREGMTIVYTTHYMEEAERLCDRVAIIDDGRIIAQGTLDELKQTGQTKETIVVSFSNLNDDLAGQIAREWSDMKRIEGSIHFASRDAKSDLSRLVLRCTDIGLDIQHIEIKKVNLETVFLELTGKQLRDA